MEPIMDRARPPAVAGSFYPSTANELRAALDHCFQVHSFGPRQTKSPSTNLLAGMVPHAGYVYSGPCAAHWYCRLDPSIERVIVLGVNHSSRGHRAALSPWKRWQTPLGVVPVDSAVNDFLTKRIPFLAGDASPHLEEHSIEVQLPFLQRALKDFSLVPISLARLDLAECAELAAGIAALYRHEAAVRHNTCLVSSSDLSHYLSPAETEELDRAALERIIALDAAGLFEVVHEKRITMCGLLPTVVMLYAARALGATRGRLLKHYHSGDIAAMRNVVGYASVAIEL
jgi:AmmeMemoRadiSam system protein B